MTSMRRVPAKIVLGLGWLGVAVSAPGVTMDLVSVGDAGNAADTTVRVDGSTGFGAVSYEYKIGKYEVTNAQYTEFLSAVAVTDTYNLYNPNMFSNPTGGIIRMGSPGSYTYSVKPGKDNHPVNFVSWFDSVRFVNWLHNGQLSGLQDASTTESGAYSLTGEFTIGAGTDPIHGANGRNAGAMFFMPSEDEWYKAAYYKGGGLNAGYWTYATQSDIAPAAVAPPGGSNSANYNFAVGSPTNVGAYVNAPSAYGTFDQAGNVWEWNEQLFVLGETAVPTYDRGLLGSSWNYTPGESASTWRDHETALGQFQCCGFRVGAPGEVIPEPSSLGLVMLGAAGAFGLFRRNRRS